MKSDVGLVVITQPQIISLEASVLNRLFISGLQHLHLRKPNADKTQLRNLISDIEPRFRSRIVMHYYVDIATEFDLGAIQINAHTTTADGWKGKICRSCHTINELSQTLDNQDYAMLSPIYDSISKIGYQSHFTLADLQASRHVLERSRVVALGGVTPERVAELHSLGFSGAAVLGALWQNADSDEILRRFDKFALASKIWH